MAEADNLDQTEEIRREERRRCAELVREAGCSHLAMCVHYEVLRRDADSDYAREAREQHDYRCPMALAARLEAET